MKRVKPRTQPAPRLSHGELLQLKRWNTPTIYHGWEQITRINAAADGFNLEAARFMDANECNHLISTARAAAGQAQDELLANLQRAFAKFGRAARDKFQRKGEF
jgi:hypothetical protein